MKRLSLIVAILTVIVLLESWGALWLRDYSEELSAELTSLSGQVDSSPDAVLEELTRIHGEWTKRRKILSIYIHENPMDSFERDLTEAILRLEEEDGEAALWMRLAADAAAEIWEREKPTVQNIL